MKQWFGFLLALIGIPLIYVLQQGIVSEWKVATDYQEVLNQSIRLESTPPDMPVLMKDGANQIFSERYVEWRSPLALSEISNFTQQLFLQSEDRGFFKHRGYDIAAIARAVAVNNESDDIQQGASTITQQLVRMKFLSTEKTYERKFKEILYSAELEKQLTKDEILEMYLNEMYFANRVYGIGGAATYYFSRPLSELAPAEIAFLAAIPNNPSIYNPLQNFERTKARQILLLDVLAKNGVISQEEAEQYKQYPIELQVKERIDRTPMYSDYVMTEFEKIIAQKHGLAQALNNAQTTEKRHRLQAELQQVIHHYLAEGVIIHTALDQQKQIQTEQQLNATLADPLQAGGVVIDNATREIVTLYAGKHFEPTGFNRATQAVRQPGSAIKPLLVYAPLIENFGYNVATPISSHDICIGNYCPGNIGGHSYGMTPLVDAFKFSHNTAAVRALRTVGIDTAFNHLQPFQFKHVVESDHNYTAALGGFLNGFTPLEIANGFSSFIDGHYVEPSTIRLIKTTNGDVIYRKNTTSNRVWNDHTVQVMRTLLQETVLTGTATSVVHRPPYTGAKTGTTDLYKDLWVAGLSSKYTASVWIGTDNSQSVQWARDANVPARAFNILLQ